MLFINKKNRLYKNTDSYNVLRNRKTKRDSTRKSQDKVRRPAPRIAMMIALFAVLLLAGCSTIDQGRSDLSDWIGPSEDVTMQPVNSTVEPKIKTLPDTEKVVLSFEEQEQTMTDFMKYSKEYLYCMLPVIENEKIADRLIKAHRENVKVRVIVDREASFVTCDPTCIPLQKSEINTLIAEDIPSRMNDLRQGFCVNEFGVVFTSSNFRDDAGGITSTMILYNDRLAEEYEDFFLDNWE